MVIRSNLALCWITLLMVSGTLAFIQEDPPTWKDTLTGLNGRSADLVSIRENTKELLYKVNYSDVGLTSEATLDLDTRAMLKEVVGGKWIITFEYNKFSDKTSHLPTKLIVHQYSKGGMLGKVISIYTFKEAIGNGKLRYVDQAGKERIIHCLYFEIVPLPF